MKPMTFATTRLLMALCLALSSAVVCGQHRIVKAAAPAWVENLDYSADAPQSADASDGYLYLLISVQNNLESKQYFRKYVIKVLSEQGLSIASSINQSFDPSFQKLTFHTLNIFRDGKRIDKMDPGKFEIIRREDAMDRAVYDKSLNAVYNLPDVRVGDIVEYSFTLTGANPIFDHHAFGTCYLQYGVPVSKIACRLLFDKNRPVSYKSFGEVPPPSEKESGSLRDVHWIRERVPALLSDDMVPSWYDPYARVQYSDFKSWKEVQAWAAKVFDIPRINSGKLSKLVQQIRELNTDLEGKIKECVRISQADIRYLSFSDGIHSYKPHSPDLVYEQKYGDCKDKSLLLSCLLKGIGVDSYPALVSTESGQTLGEILPNPFAFNHCIVNFTYADSVYWIDPTLDTQVGPLAKYSIPLYKNGLVVDPSRTGLEAIPDAYQNSRIDVKEEYFVDEVGGYVTLSVDSKYYGDEAESMRSYVATRTKEEIHKNYLNFYAKDYSDISLEEDVVFDDNKAENVFTGREKYRVKNFWTKDADGKYNASVYARVLSSYINKPETRLRTMPLAVTYPRHVTQTIKVYLPEDWDVQDMAKAVDSDGFAYRSSTLYNNRIITMRYSYESKASFVETAAAADHIAKLDEVLNDLNLNIYKSPDASGDAGRSGEFLLAALMVGLAVYFIRKKFR